MPGRSCSAPRIEWTRAEYPPADRVPVVPRGNAAGSGGAGEPAHGAGVPEWARAGAGLAFRLVRAGVLPCPEGRPGPAGGTVDRVGSGRWRSARNRALKAAGCAQRDIGPQAVVGAP